MRAFLEIAIPLLLPALFYWLYLSIQQKRGKQVQEVPMTWLAVIGVCFVLIVLGVSWLDDGQPIGGKYIPPSVVDGKIVPGHFENPPPTP